MKSQKQIFLWTITAALALGTSQLLADDPSPAPYTPPGPDKTRIEDHDGKLDIDSNIDGSFSGLDGLPCTTIVAILQQQNMTAVFTLTADQKTQIKIARQDFAARRSAWERDHKPDLADAQRTVQNALKVQDKDALAGAVDALNDIYKDAPKSAGMDARIESILTDAQKKVLDDIIAKRIAAQPK
jgi:hypothetical protein